MARSAHAQDALPDLPAPAAPPEAAPPVADAPPPAPSAPAPPSQAPVVAEPPPTPTPTPVAPTPAPPGAGNAAFEPLPESPPTHPKRKPRAPASTPKPATPADAPVADAPVAASADAPVAAPTEVNHADPHADDKDNDDSSGPFAPFRLGVLVGGGLPEILSLGGQLKLTRFFGAGVNIGIIPTVKISYYGDATLAYQEYDAYGHIYPFGGSFFLGAGVGYASIKGSLASKFNLAPVQAMYPTVLNIPASVAVTSEASVRTLVLTPQIGFLKIFGAGFALGIDIGAQIPIAPSKVDFATAAPGLPEPIASAVQTKYINPNDEKVRSTLDKIGRTPLPTFNLRIGWFL